MDYKEKYEQAMARMKKWVNGSVITEPKEVSEFVFPELRESESENEKIRKELISLFQDGIDGVSHRYSGSDCSRWIAWVKKQGTDSSSFPEEQRKYMEKYLSFDKVTLIKLLAERDRNVEEATKSLERQDKCIGCNNFKWCITCINGDHYAYAPEQNPTDKVKPKFKVGNKIKLTEEPKYPAREIIAIKNDAYCFDKLEQLPFINQDKWELVEQTPADKIEQNPTWNEEDEMMLETVLDKIGDLGTGEMCKEWLKSLKDRVQPNPKQEWSEEDKKLIDDTCNLINTLASGYGENVTEPITLSGTQMITSIKDRLRALVDNRPQSTWKPSKDQMSCLKQAYKYYLSGKIKITGVTLESLYVDLSKIMKR